jgi:hypothetical protein
VVPEDFPRNTSPAALAGSQPKVAAQLIDGRYVVGLTDEERQNRYLYCADLVEQLMMYTHRKQLELPDLPLEQLLSQIDASIRRKDWELSAIEYDWIMQQLRGQLQMPVASTPRLGADTSALPSEKSKSSPSSPRFASRSSVGSTWVDMHTLEHIPQALRFAIGDEPLESVAQRADLSVHEVEVVLSGQPDYTMRTLQALLQATGQQCLIMPAYAARLLAVPPGPREHIPSLIDDVRYL